MAGTSVEEFWNNSSGDAFNFDDEEPEKYHSILHPLEATNKKSVFVSSLDDETSLSILPIHSIITKRNLNAVLDDMYTPIQSVIPSIQETVLKMFLGMPYMLSMYRSLDQKLELLDEAIVTDDGNIILEVMLYLRKSLKLSKLYNHLIKRKLALQHYVNYLMKELNLDELANIYMYTRNFVDIVYLFYLKYKDTSNKNRTLQILTKFLSDHQHKLDRDKEVLFLEFKNFTQWQIENNFLCVSVIEQLAELYKIELSSNKEKRIIEFKQLFKITDFQYEWTTLNAFCALQMWPKLISVFIKPNWLTKKNSFKSVVNIELFIQTLFGHDPPKKLLEEFLGCMVATEESLILAKKMCCHKFIIDSYVLQKDRQSIMQYKQQLPPQSEDYFYVESVLQAQDKKWKN